MDAATVHKRRGVCCVYVCPVQWYCWPEGFIGQSFSLAGKMQPRASPLLDDVETLYQFTVRRREVCSYTEHTIDSAESASEMVEAVVGGAVDMGMFNASGSASFSMSRVSNTAQQQQQQQRSQGSPSTRLYVWAHTCHNKHSQSALVVTAVVPNLATQESAQTLTLTCFAAALHPCPQDFSSRAVSHALVASFQENELLEMVSPSLTDAARKVLMTEGPDVFAAR